MSGSFGVAGFEDGLSTTKFFVTFGMMTILYRSAGRPRADTG
jgi:hypothetical protein